MTTKTEGLLICLVMAALCLVILRGVSNRVRDRRRLASSSICPTARFALCSCAMNRTALIAELTRDEGDRSEIYDDATGETIKAGSLVKGVPTLGVGITGPFDAQEKLFLLNSRIDRALHGLGQSLPWLLGLDDVRQRALCSMAFNLGVDGLLKWHKTLGFMAAKNWEAAANEIENSHPWIDQVGARGHRIAAMIRTGVAK